ncbi:MAG: PAS domain S-box protein, partial [Ginsengibacter sp.]
RSVFSKEIKSFELEYPCHSFTEQRWFSLSVTSFGEDDTKAVVSHQNITRRKIAEQKSEKSESGLKEAQAVANIGSWETDLQTLTVTWSEQTHHIFATDPKKFQATHDAFLSFIHPADRNKVNAAFENSMNSREINSIEHSIIATDGRVKHVIENWRIFHDVDGSPVRALGTCQDITERKKAEEKLKIISDVLAIASERLLLATTSAKIGVWDWDIEKDMMNWDKRMYELYGIGAQQFTGAYSFWQKGVHPDDIERAANELNDAIKGVSDLNTEFRVVWPDGSIHFIEAHAIVSRNEAGVGVRMIGINTDITQRKEAENKLNGTSKELENAVIDLNKILDSSLDVIYTMNANGEFVKVSAASQQVWGYKPEELIGTKIMNLVYHEDLEITIKAAKKLANNIQVPLFENRYVHKNGKIVPMLWSIKWDDELQLTFCVAKDVTEKKILEKAVETERDQFFEILSKAPSAIGMMKGADHVFEMTNPVYLKLIGKKNVIGKTFAEARPELIEQGLLNIINDVYTTGIPYANPEMLVKIDKEGNGKLTEAYVSLVYQAYKNNQGIIEGVLFFANDVTEQILSRKIIEKSEKFFKGVIESSDDMITIIDAAGQTIYASPAVAKKFGYTSEECLRFNIADIVHPDDEMIMHEFVGKVMMNPGVPMECPIIRDRKKDGTYMWVEGTFTNFLDTEGINAIVANFRDITERKKADEEISFKANLLNTIGQAAIATDLNGVVSYWNKAAETIYGWTTEEVTGKNIMLLTPSNANKEQAIAVMDDLKNGRSWAGEFKVQRKNGSEFPALVTNSPIYDEHDKLCGIIGISSDITEKKKLEDLLDKTNQLARIGNYELSLVNNTLYWSDITKQIHEVDTGFIPNVATAIDFYKPDESREAIIYGMKELIERNIPFELEVQIITAKGNDRWVKVIGEAEHDDGKCTRLYGSFQDIDKAKKAEIELLKVYEEKNAILESIEDGFFAVDTNWIITYWNKQSEKMSHMRTNEMIGKNLWEVYSDIIDSPYYINLNKAITDNAAQHFENYSETTETWYEVSAYPSENGLSVYFRDITERKLAEQQIKADRVLLRTLIDHLPDTIYYKDKSAKKIISNKFDYTLLGAEREQEVLGKTDLEISSHAHAAVTYAQDMEILSTGKPLIDFEEYFTTADNEPLWLLTTKLALRNENNEITGLLGIGRDITQRKVAENKLIELNTTLEKNVKQLKISNADLEQFAFVASHDLQEPLRMVTSFLTLLEKKYGNSIDDKGKQYINFAVDGAKRMRQIILDLLEFSRVGRAEDKTEEVDLNALVNDIVRLHSKQITETNALLNISKLPVLNVSREPMRQVFQNLMSNSLKYHKNGIAPEISITAKSAGKFWQFAIADNGIGIGEAYLEKIFIIFQRLHDKEQFTGTGIGLAITKKIIENTGGSIRVESEEGKGSTFYFTLPKQQLS